MPIAELDMRNYKFEGFYVLGVCFRIYICSQLKNRVPCFGLDMILHDVLEVLVLLKSDGLYTDLYMHLQLKHSLGWGKVLI